MNGANGGRGGIDSTGTSDTGAGSSTTEAGGAASVTVAVAVAVTVGGWAVTVTVFVTVDDVGVVSSRPEAMFPITPNRTSPPTRLPPMTAACFLNGRFRGVVKKSPGDRADDWSLRRTIHVRCKIASRNGLKGQPTYFT